MRCQILLPMIAAFSILSTNVSTAEDKAENKPSINKERIDELTKKIEANPKDDEAFRLRAFEYAKGHAWDKAVIDYMQIAKIQGGNSQIGQQIGVLLVLADDKKTHKTLCEEMIKGFKDSESRGDLERTAKICALFPEPVGKLEDLLKMSRKSVEMGKNRDFACHHYRTLALILYRMKKYDEALEAIESADEADAKARFQIPNVIVSNRAIEAMCWIQTGKHDKAKTILAKATSMLTEKFKAPTPIYQDQYWHDWLVAKVLHDEAQELLANAKKKSLD